MPDQVPGIHYDQLSSVPDIVCRFTNICNDRTFYFDHYLAKMLQFLVVDRDEEEGRQMFSFPGLKQFSSVLIFQCSADYRNGVINKINRSIRTFKTLAWSSRLCVVCVVWCDVHCLHSNYAMSRTGPNCRIIVPLNIGSEISLAPMQIFWWCWLQQKSNRNTENEFLVYCSSPKMFSSNVPFSMLAIMF